MTIEISCAARGRYHRYAGALLASLAGQDVHVHYLHGADLSRWAKRRLERVADGAITFHEIADERVAGLPVREYFTPAMWFRVLLPELVERRRVLYLDVDTLVLDDLAPLWDTPLEGWVGAVGNVWMPDHLSHAERLDIAPEDYFNSGVLLLDLDALRREDVARRLRETAMQRGEQGWPDQDALNLVLAGRWQRLDPRWNTMNSYWTVEDPALVAARERPGIRHFEGPGVNKPWRRGASGPHVAEWRQALKASRQV